MKSGDRSNKIVIDFYPERCLFARSIWADCAYCATTCPRGAISFETPVKPPVVDADMCIQCGQCLSSCPAEAFESSSFSEKQLLARLPEGKDVRIHCFLPYDALSSLSSGVTTYQLGTCLASLTSGALFEMALHRTCELSTQRCADCSLFDEVEPTMKRNFQMASALLADWNRDGALVDLGNVTAGVESCVDDKVNAQTCNAENTSSDSEMAGFSQDEPEGKLLTDDREIQRGFSFVPDSVRGAIGKLFERDSRPLAEVKPIKLRQVKPYLPNWMSRLRATWIHEGPAPSQGFPWPVMEVDTERCKACGMCMQMCPTGAITLLQGDGEFIHSMTPGSCIDCYLCIKSCLAGALSRSYQELENPFEPLERSSQDATPCVRCGLPVLVGDGPYCRLCSSDRDALSLHDRVKNQMATIRESTRKAGAR